MLNPEQLTPAQRIYLIRWQARAVATAIWELHNGCREWHSMQLSLPDAKGSDGVRLTGSVNFSGSTEIQVEGLLVYGWPSHRLELTQLAWNLHMAEMTPSEKELWTKYLWSHTPAKLYQLRKPPKGKDPMTPTDVRRHDAPAELCESVCRLVLRCTLLKHQLKASPTPAPEPVER